MKLLLFIFAFSTVITCFSQTANIVKGNRYYKDSAFDKAEEQYRKSISKKPTSAAQYNLGNTLYQKQKTKEAIEQYDETASSAIDGEVKAKALYNKGVVYHRNNQLDEAIGAYKEALRLTPDDAEIRKNLQIALKAKRQQKPKEQKKKQEPPKEEKKKEEQKPPPPPKISKKQAEQYLKSLSEKERQLQEKMQKKRPVPDQPEKDW